MSLAEIHSAIPHREPMLLLDEILEQTENHIVCKKSFHPNEFFFQGHYPRRPLVPGVILCESALQAGAVLLANLVESGEGMPVATRMNEVKFKRMVRPGETVIVDVSLDERLAGAFFMSAKVTCDDKVAVRLQFACTITQIDP